MKFDENADLTAQEQRAISVANLKEEGYRIIKPVPASFKRWINGREAIVIESEL